MIPRSTLRRPAGGERLRVGRTSAVLATVVFWVVLLFLVAEATQVLGLQAFTDWLARLIDHLPTLIAGVLITGAGYIVSRFVADLLLATATRLAHTQRLALARVAQLLILVGAFLVGADQVGIKITFLAIFAAGAAATIVGGVALAVGFGARDYIANLIGAHYMRQAFPVGQFIRAPARRPHPGSNRHGGRHDQVATSTNVPHSRAIFPLHPSSSILHPCSSSFILAPFHLFDVRIHQR
jgi:hypothetical protein